MPDQPIHERPDPDHVYRRFSAKAWWQFFEEITGGAVKHQPGDQDCPFCHATAALAVFPAGGLRPPSFSCLCCERSGDVLDFIAEYEQFRLEPRGDALDLMGRWAGEHALPEVAGNVVSLRANGRGHDEWRDGADFRGDPESFDAPLPLARRCPMPIDGRVIPQRQWIVPGLLLRRNLSVLVAPPASGKSLLTLQLAIAIALGIPWGGWRPRAPEKVFIINAEDDYDEMCRRLYGAVTEMGVDQAALADRIFLAETPESIVIARMDHKTKTVIRTPLVERLVETIGREGIGVTIADPFAETFEGDENSNSEVKWAGILWREVARRTASSLMLVHHTRKFATGMAGEQDASRGASALIGCARIMSTLFNMTEPEAALYQVPPEERDNYVRFDDAKSNHSAKGVVKWFRKGSVTLPNGTPEIAGDEVGVLVPWKPPGVFGGVDLAVIGLILDRIARGVVNDNGEPTGGRWRPLARADHWVGEVFISALELDGDDEADRLRVRTMIKQWLDNGVLQLVDHVDPGQRKARKSVEVVPENRPDRGLG
jgi:hypothetical protein